MIEIQDGNEEVKEEATPEVEVTTAEATETTDNAAEEKTPAAAYEKKPAQEGYKRKGKDKRKRDRSGKVSAASPEKDKRDDKIEELTKQNTELTDHLKRNLAEFDNFRKRTEKEKAAMFDMGAKSVIEKLLPVIDNFERGLGSIGPDQKPDDSFANGMDMVYKQMLKIFTDLGVEVIDTKDQEFDPNLHNAVMHVEDENLGENMIAQEFQKGYKFKDSVIRHSMVQVAN